MGAALLECKYSEAEVEVVLRPSRVATMGLAVMSAATLAVVAMTPGPAVLKLVIATCVACMALEAVQTIALRRGRRGVRAILLRRSREIEVEMASGAWEAGVVLDGSFVAPWLTIVRWRPEGARFERSILILPDMLSAEGFRTLRVLLRWS
jgi:toxin CptA